MYVRPFRSYFLALHGQTYIQLFWKNITFYVFLKFLSKNVALAEEIEFRVSSIFHVGCIFPRQAWANIHGILVLRCRKTELTSCEFVCVDVCMYVTILS